MSEEAPDEEVWQRAVAGDAGARERVAELAADYGRAALQRRGVSRNDLDDLVQEVVCKVEICRKQAVEVRFFRKFVYFRALATLKEHWARQRRGPSDLSQSIDPGSDCPAPDVELEVAELLQAVAECRDSLPDSLRMVILLRHNSDLLIREIAEELSLTMGGVRGRFRRAWGLLQDCLRGRGFGPEDVQL